ncbi:melatonin receptor type 1B [Manacus vitellinus]|nr:melatonin receptor type 1B [Manacus vitellinus]
MPASPVCVRLSNHSPRTSAKIEDVWKGCLGEVVPVLWLVLGLHIKGTKPLRESRAIRGSGAAHPGAGALRSPRGAVAAEQRRALPRTRGAGLGAGSPPDPSGPPLFYHGSVLTTRQLNSLVVESVLPFLLPLLSLRTSSTRKVRNAGNAFVVSLALADLVVALYPYPLVLLAIFHNGWTLGEMHCKASGFVMGLSVIGSIFNITAIAINRYCYICHSFAYDKVYSCWNTMLYVSLVWILTVIATVPNFFVGSLKYDPRIYSCTFVQTASSYYTIAVVVIHFIVPITIVSFCYLRIWVLVLQVRRRVKSETKPRLKPSDFRNFLTMFVVFVIFAFCWAPLNFIGLAVAIDPTEMAPKVPEWLFIISYLMAYFNSCLNAIIYGLLNQNFRNEYKRILMSLWMPRLFFQDTSKGGTDGQKSKPSPALNNNNQMKTDTL